MTSLKLCILSLAVSQAQKMEANGRSESLKLQQDADTTALLQENKIEETKLSGAPQISDLGLISEALSAAPKASNIAS